MYRRFFSLIVALFITINIAYAQDAHWMPDPALRGAVREKLGIPADSPLTRAYVQEHLTGLNAIDKGIVDLTGLEHATDLQVLILIGNKIRDLSPLSDLTGLYFLDLAGNQISDLRPLAGLTALEVLRLGGNQIRDVSPLAGLVNLKELLLSGNPISDLSPLAGLENLEDLRIRHTNTKGVLSTLPISKLIQFGYDGACDLAGVPISERVESREYPSVATLFGNIINLPHLSWNERLAYHDLYGSSQLFDLQWLPTVEGLKTFLHVESAKENRDYLRSLNPNMLFIVGMNYVGANPGEYPEDWPYWVRDESENIIPAEEHGTLLIDFTYPEIQDYLVRQAVEFAQCGLFDGIIMDVWRDGWQNSKNAHYYASDVSEAAITLLRRIREAVGDDFLILVHSNRTKVPRSAPYVNGMFMETISSPLHGYSHEQLAEIENTLLWGEQNLQEPQINCLEGWAGVDKDTLDSPTNQRGMRAFTTLSLTHSDGYVNFVSGISSLEHAHLSDIWKEHSETHASGVKHSHLHDHIWYPFYDAPLGRPMGGVETKGVLYQTPQGVPIEGLFIREFTNGWAVYNRSGESQTITLPSSATSVSDRGSTAASVTHLLPDLDGEIYLKAKNPADVNGDGSVNILDLSLIHI